MRLDFHKNHWLLLGTILFGFVALSLLIAVFPAIWVQNNSHPLPGAEPLTASEFEGLKTYLSEGCVYCHTQQVRPLEMDASFGRPSVPGDYAYLNAIGPFSPNAPAVLGSQRTGPDLTTVGQRQGSEVWQLMHLYNPRSVVPGSVMPSFPWMFEVVEEAGPNDTVVPVPPAYAPDVGVVIAKQKALDLTAYLLSLRQLPVEEVAQ